MKKNVEVERNGEYEITGLLKYKDLVWTIIPYDKVIVLIDEQ
jgi:hypothetical protein